MIFHLPKNASPPAGRDLRLWAMLTEEVQNRAIPYSVHEAVDFVGLNAARAQMVAPLAAQPQGPGPSRD